MILSDEYRQMRSQFKGLSDYFKQLEQKTIILLQIKYKSGIVHGIHSDKEGNIIDRWSYFGKNKKARLFIIDSVKK